MMSNLWFCTNFYHPNVTNSEWLTPFFGLIPFYHWHFRLKNLIFRLFVSPWKSQQKNDFLCLLHPKKLRSFIPIISDATSCQGNSISPKQKYAFLEVPLFLQLYIIIYNCFLNFKKCQLPSWNQKKLFFSGCKLKSQIKQISLRGKRKLWESSLPIRLVYSCLIKSWHLFLYLAHLALQPPPLAFVDLWVCL